MDRYALDFCRAAIEIFDVKKTECIATEQNQINIDLDNMISDCLDAYEEPKAAEQDVQCLGYVRVNQRILPKLKLNLGRRKTINSGFLKS